MTIARALPFVAVGAYLVSLYPASAVACSLGACTPAELAPGQGKPVPADIPALVFRPGFSWTASEVDETAFVLTQDDGTQVPLEFQHSGPTILLVPKATLKPNHWYSLNYPEGCPDSSPLGIIPAHQLPLSRPFLVRDPIGLNRAFKLGLVEFTNGVESIRVPTTAGTCATQITAAVARLWSDPSPLGLLLNVGWCEVLVDGETWATSAPGLCDLDPTPRLCPTTDPVGREPLVIFARCGERHDSDDNGLQEGLHHLEFRFHLPVVGMIASTSRDVLLSCAGGGPASDATTEPGEYPIAEPTFADAANDADTLDSEPSQDTSRTGSGACNSHPTASQQSALLLLALIPVFLSLRRFRASSTGRRAAQGS